MNENQARQVLRWNKNCSIRQIHVLYEKIYNDKIVIGNQIDGMLLIEEANKILKQGK